METLVEAQREQMARELVAVAPPIGFGAGGECLDTCGRVSLQDRHAQASRLIPNVTEGRDAPGSRFQGNIYEVLKFEVHLQ